MKLGLLLPLLGATTLLAAGPLLKITPPTANFGKFKANLRQQRDFTLTNVGDEPLKIDKVRVSCGCSAAEVECSELKPGESTVLRAALKPESIEGPFAKGVFIHSNAANGAIQMLTLNGEALPLVKVKPQKMLHAGVRPPGEPFRQEFLLQSDDKVEFAAPEVSGDLRPEAVLTRLSDRETRLVLTFTPQTALPRFRTAVRIAIAAPRNWKPVEILIEGVIKP